MGDKERLGVASCGRPRQGPQAQVHRKAQRTDSVHRRRHPLPHPQEVGGGSPPRTHFLLSVHDELVLECPKEDARGVALWLKAKMGEAMEEILGTNLGGPKCAEVGYGPCWGECVELEES